ncbi:MAG: AMP-binding protein, partial [Acidimicrobiales bacterium]
APTVVVYGADHATTVDELRSGVTTARAWIAVDGLDELISAAPGEPAIDADVTLDHDAVILYTSGTTGRPKGAVLTHGNLTFNTMNQLAHADVLGQDTALCVSPLFHATGLGQVSLPTLFKGGCVVVLPRFDAGVVLATIARLGIASFSAVPTMLQLLCDHGDFGGTDLRSLRYVIYGGSMVAERVAVAWQRRGVPILQGYGMTEASPGVYLAPADGAVQRPVSVGVPHFFTDVRLRPVDGGDASAGELLVRGPSVAQGAISGDGWLHTGDLGRFDAAGRLEIVGRAADTIVTGGENVAPTEVEAVLLEHGTVSDAAVLGRPDPEWGEAVVALVVPRLGV